MCYYNIWRRLQIDILADINVFGDILQLKIPREQMQEITELAKSKVVIGIKKYRQSRSLNANAYCWVLCQEIAETLSKDKQYISKETVYRKAIKDCGHCTMISVKQEAVKPLIAHWQANGLGWIAEEVSETTLALYHGSSTYNTAEMARLIDCLQDEAKQLDIRLRADAEVEKMVEKWGAAK